MSHYDTLGLRRDATPEHIEKAWKRARSTLHPDRHPDLKGDEVHSMAAAFARAKDAFDCLSDPARRAEYDATGRDSGSAEDADAGARSVLCTLLMQHLDCQEPLLQVVNSRLKGSIYEKEQRLAQMRKSRERMVINRGAVTHKSGGENLIHSLADQALAMLDAHVDRSEKSVALQRRALALLDAYEETTRIGGGRSRGITPEMIDSMTQVFAQANAGWGSR